MKQETSRDSSPKASAIRPSRSAGYEIMCGGIATNGLMNELDW